MALKRHVPAPTNRNVAAPVSRQTLACLSADKIPMFTFGIRLQFFELIFLLRKSRPLALVPPAA